MENNTITASLAFKNYQPRVLTFPYVYLSCSELWFASGEEFNRADNAFMWVNGGGVYPLAPPYQGSEAHCYNFTLQSTREFFVSRVIGPFLESDAVDGLFFDMIDSVAWGWATGWHVSDKDVVALQEGTLLLLDEMLSAMKQHNKVGLLSTHSSKTSLPDLNKAATVLMLKYGAFHFYEFFCPTFDANCADQISTIYIESNLGVPVQAHAPFKSKDQLLFQLSCFLICAGKFSYFSWGVDSGWSTQSFPFPPEFSKPLGTPLADATRPDNMKNFIIKPNIDGIFAGVPKPGSNSSDGLVVFSGKLSSAEECQAKCLLSPNALAGCQSWTWHGEGAGVWAGGCYLRFDFQFKNVVVDQGLTIVSGMLPVVFQRKFEHAVVWVDVLNNKATIQWE